MAWIPLQYAGRLILAGDPCQLPPTILSAEAIAGGLQVSLMERLMDLLGPQISRRLDVQYRMHQRIMAFSSAEFYAGSLVAHPSVRDHLLRDLPVIIDNDLTATPIDFIDTAGASYVRPRAGRRQPLNPLEGRTGSPAGSRRCWMPAGPGQAGGHHPLFRPGGACCAERLKQTEIENDSVVEGFQGARRKPSSYRWSVPPAGEIGFLETLRRTTWSHPRPAQTRSSSATAPRHRSSLYQRWSAISRDSEAYHPRLGGV